MHSSHINRIFQSILLLIPHLILIASHPVVNPLNLTSVREEDAPFAQYDGTIYQFLATNGSDPSKKFDNNSTDYDILKNFIEYVGDVEPILNDANKRLTLLAVSDEAFKTTVGDIIEKYSLDLNGTDPYRSEATVFEFLKKQLSLTHDKPKEIISSFLKYHIIIGEFEQCELRGAGKVEDFNTAAGKMLPRSGNKFGDSNSVPPGTALPQINLQVPETSTSNGYIHYIDRMIWPPPTESPRGTTPPAQNTATAQTTLPPQTPPPAQTFHPIQTPIARRSQSPTTSASPVPALSNTENASCFPASATLHLHDHSDIGISSVNAGHEVLVSGGASSAVYLFTHRESEGVFKFLRIQVENGCQITLTKGHYLYANQRLVAAEDVKIGDILQTLDGLSRVRSIDVVMERGLFAPHTLHGDIVVNRILVSSYTTAVPPRIAHTLLWPLRMVARLRLMKEPLGSLLYNGSPRIWRLLANLHSL